jgi:HAD superfamily phosphoserine phosphatase-like hydrolase
VRFLVRGFTATVAHGLAEATKMNKSYLTGLRVSDVGEYADLCFRERIAPGVSSEAVLKVEALKESGYRILIISGAPSFLMQHLEPVVRPDFTICTELEVKDGRYTGDVVGAHPFGKRKRRILEEARESLDIDFTESIVFANHHSDAHHMELFGHAVAVNSTRKLRRLAIESGWEITTWA